MKREEGGGGGRVRGEGEAGGAKGTSSPPILGRHICRAGCCHGYHQQ